MSAGASYKKSIENSRITVFLSSHMYSTLTYMLLLLHIVFLAVFKIKVKFTPEQAMKDVRGGRYIALHFL